MRLFVFTFLIFISFVTSSFAQPTGSWGAWEVHGGVGQGICNTTNYERDCIALACSAAKGIYFEVQSKNERSTEVVNDEIINHIELDISVIVDGKTEHVFHRAEGDTNQTFPFDPSIHSGLVQALGAGNRVQVLNRNGAQLSLRGSSKALFDTLQNCQTMMHSLQNPPMHAQFRRFSDEATLELDVGEPSTFRQFQNADIWGHDMVNWLEDPLYHGVELEQCERLCSLTSGCQAYTHNGRNDVCILKSQSDELERYTGATTGVLNGTSLNILPPPTPGHDLLISPDAAWRDGETTDAYFTRLRQLSASLGASCEAETADLENLAKSFRPVPVTSNGTVNQPISVEWRGNTLRSRIPVWFMVTADKPVRFTGDGFYALGADAPNPFGIQVGQGKDRALVALYARGAGENGTISVLPLQAGDVALEVKLVGYLRQCDEEIILSEQSMSISISPESAEIVLTNATVQSSYHTSLLLEEWDRQIEFNDTRFLVRTIGSQTEIVERNGTEISLSPTKRFVAIRSDDAFEVVDLIDGATVARLAGWEINWVLGDSYVYTDSFPWGKVGVGSLLSDNVSFDGKLTGPSCCLAKENGFIEISLENNVINIWGSFGYKLTALQNPGFTIESSSPHAWGSSEDGSHALYRQFINSVGPVSSQSIDSQVQFVGGVAGSYSQKMELGEWVFPTRREKLAELQLNGAIASLIQQLPPNQVNEFEHNQTFYRKGLNAVPAQSGIENHLSRLNIFTASFQNAEKTYQILELGFSSFQDHVDPPDDYVVARDAVDTYLQEVGFEFSWNKTDEFMIAVYCDHISTSSSFENVDVHNKLPDHFDQIQQLISEKSQVLILRAQCTGGPTGGTLVGKSMMFIIDLNEPFSGDTRDWIIGSNTWSVSVPDRKFYEPNFEVKQVGRQLLMYAPSEGIIWMFDLDRREVFFVKEGLPNGDLLKDAWLTEDRQHVVQLNSDGGLYFHRVADGAQVLSGRIVDDEIVVWTEDYLFDATAEGASFIDLKFPGIEGQFSLDRFDSSLRVPNLANLVLSGSYLPTAPTISVPPALIADIKLTGEDIYISAKATGENSVPILRVYQDGVLSDLLDLSGGAEPHNFSIERIDGARWVSVIAEDETGLVSLPASLDLGSDPKGAPSTRLLAVGVDRYQADDLPSLNFAKPDARTVVEAISALPSDVAQLQAPVVLTDRRATPEAILNAATELVKGLEPGDHAVFFFAGHGLKNEAGEFFLGTSETDTNNLSQTALSWTELAQVLSATRARVTILLDACHSGAAGTGVFATNDDAVANFMASSPPNITILSASKGREFSGESASLGGGAFSQALAQVIGEQRDEYDLNGNGIIEVSELYAGVKAKVVSDRGGLQTPWLSNSRMVGDYAVF